MESGCSVLNGSFIWSSSGVSLTTWLTRSYWRWPLSHVFDCLTSRWAYMLYRFIVTIFFVHIRLPVHLTALKPPALPLVVARPPPPLFLLLPSVLWVGWTTVPFPLEWTLNYSVILSYCIVMSWFFFNSTSVGLACFFCFVLGFFLDRSNIYLP